MFRGGRRTRGRGGRWPSMSSRKRAGAVGNSRQPERVSRGTRHQGIGNASQGIENVPSGIASTANGDPEKNASNSTSSKLPSNPNSSQLKHKVTLLLGTFFLVAQGYEWVQLLKFGMTVSSSVYGGLFYLIIGAHGFHVVGVLAVLIHAWNRLGASNNPITAEGLLPLQLLWYFVVCVWPVLYVLVYLT
jgi:hypothetical protein